MRKIFTLLIVAILATATSWAAEKSIVINTANSGVTGSYSNKTFNVDGITFGFNQWMKNNNIQAKKSTPNSLYNESAIPGKITRVVFEQTGTARAIKVFGGSNVKPTNAIASPKTSGTMEFDFSGKGYTFFSMTTPSNAVYFSQITILRRWTRQNSYTALLVCSNCNCGLGKRGKGISNFDKRP